MENFQLSTFQDDQACPVSRPSRAKKAESVKTLVKISRQVKPFGAAFYSRPPAIQGPPKHLKPPVVGQDQETSAVSAYLPTKFLAMLLPSNYFT